MDGVTHADEGQPSVDVSSLFVQMRIEVVLPGSITDDGGSQTFTLSRMIDPSQFGMKHYRRDMPGVVNWAANVLESNMRWS